MFDVSMEFQCGCFKKNGYEAIQSFNSKDAAVVRANAMVVEMNENFCGAHRFCVADEGERIVITVKSNF